MNEWQGIPLRGLGQSPPVFSPPFPEIARRSRRSAKPGPLAHEASLPPRATSSASKARQRRRAPQCLLQTLFAGRPQGDTATHGAGDVVKAQRGNSSTSLFPASPPCPSGRPVMLSVGQLEHRQVVLPPVYPLTPSALSKRNPRSDGIRTRGGAEPSASWHSERYPERRTDSWWNQTRLPARIGGSKSPAPRYGPWHRVRLVRTMVFAIHSGTVAIRKPMTLRFDAHLRGLDCRTPASRSRATRGMAPAARRNGARP